jgi:hypothetical protein
MRGSRLTMVLVFLATANGVIGLMTENWSAAGNAFNACLAWALLYMEEKRNSVEAA